MAPHWSPNEENQLREVVARYGTSCWEEIARALGGRRSSSAYQKRWHENIKPRHFYRGPWTKAEDRILMAYTHLRGRQIFANYCSRNLSGRDPKIAYKRLTQLQEKNNSREPPTTDSTAKGSRLSISPYPTHDHGIQRKSMSNTQASNRPRSSGNRRSRNNEDTESDSEQEQEPRARSPIPVVCAKNTMTANPYQSAEAVTIDPSSKAQLAVRVLEASTASQEVQLMASQWLETYFSCD